MLVEVLGTSYFFCFGGLYLLRYRELTIGCENRRRREGEVVCINDVFTVPLVW